MSEPIKLVIAIPTPGRVEFGFAFSLAGLVGRLCGGIPTRDGEALEFSIDGQVSSVIHSNRELLVRRAIDRGMTHLLFIDDDMAFDPRAIDILLGRRQPIVACNYLIKKPDDEDPTFVAVAPNGRRIITRAESAGLQEIAYSGFGLSLFEVYAFAKTPQPWFLPKFIPEASAYTTEDNPCFERLREAGFKCYVDHDASKLIEHCGVKRWKWDQWRPAAKKEQDEKQPPLRNGKVVRKQEPVAEVA